ncbi:hypothetical protein HHK36_014444 [Tetracentron sinense]|uniref:2Fe-2S ferredoxin-type domain-containing protein n=1 Tax=Tetracentron sinense TaxID=13715 RepID=A0A834Z8A6_TETSI|nr:hypothetical protein HHK36_014444 [Tetracentron sinense]
MSPPVSLDERQLTSVTRAGYLQGSCSRYLHPLILTISVAFSIPASPPMLLSSPTSSRASIPTLETLKISGGKKPRVSQHVIFGKHHPFSTTAAENEQKEKISVTFIDKDGEEKHIKVPIGMSMLEAAHENDIELEGACEGSLACSTCHVIVMDVDYYNKLEDPTDEENDMLDLAFGLTETSRLGCQVIAKPELDGLHLALPAATRNFAVDGYVPKPH